MNRHTKEHTEACHRQMQRLHSHLTMLESSIERGKIIRLWMSVNSPTCGCTFWSKKPASIFCDDMLIFDDGGVKVAGELLYSMPILFPKIALLSAGRCEVEIADISDDVGLPAYVFRRL